MAIKILVVEDEKRMYNYLKKMLLKIDDGYDITGPITNVAELKDTLQSEEHYDLSFPTYVSMVAPASMPLRWYVPRCQ